MNPNPTPSEASSEVKFEIGHVLFIDIVGYSKLLIHEQSEQLQKLKGLVRGTRQIPLREQAPSDRPGHLSGDARRMRKRLIET
jgi:hypothetical protein